MAIKTIPLSRLETELEKKSLNECADTGETVVVELSDQRLLAIHSLDPREDDSLLDELIQSSPIQSQVPGTRGKIESKSA